MMKNEHKILLKFGLYVLTFLIIIGVGISKIFADAVPLGTQYATGQMCTSDNTCAWVENTNFYNGVLISTPSLSRRPRTFGWNVNINANVNSTYTAKFTLAFYYDYAFDQNGYWYFRDYIQSANVQFGELNGNSKNVSCSTSALERSNNLKSDKIQVTCIFTPKASGSKYYFLGVTNSSYTNYGLVPFGSGTSFTIESNTMEMSTDNSGTIINQNQTIINQNQQQLQEQKETNETSKGILGKLKDLFNWLTNKDDADVSSAGNTAGWLPPGPIDSIITLPLTMLNNINSSLNKTCSPLNVNLPYVNKSVEIPCLSDIFNQITGLNSFWTWVGLISSVFILYRYLIELYKYYDRLTTLQANFISDWGSI